jgi:hypothetical protein
MILHGRFYYPCLTNEEIESEKVKLTSYNVQLMVMTEQRLEPLATQILLSLRK